MKTNTTILFSLIMLFGFTGSVTGQVTSAEAWINEFHYDNDGVDEGEFVEVVIKNSSSYTISDFVVHLYNGSNGESYGSQTLDIFTEGETVGDYTFFYWEPSSIQNGPDGISLTHDETLVQFLSYGGTFQGFGGPADGVSSVDVGVTETGSTQIGESLQLKGAGYGYEDFTWSGPSEDSPGELNSGQFLYPTVQFSASGVTVNEADGTINIEVKVVNPDGNTIDVDVVFQQSPSTAQANDFSSSTTQTVQFGSGAADGETQNATFTLENDSDYEGIENAQFILTNISTSGTAEIDGQTEFTLMIEDDDAPNIVINEVNKDPGQDADGNGTFSTADDEFIEIYNNEDVSIDLSGWYITESGPNTLHTFSEGVILQPKSAIVIFDDSAVPTGSFGGSIVFVGNSGDFSLVNGGSTVTLLDSDDNVMDAVSWGSSSFGDGESIVRDPDGIGTFVDHSTATGSVGNISPGTKVNGEMFTNSLVIEGNSGWRMLSAPVENMPISEITDDTRIQGFGDGFDKNLFTGYDGTGFTAPEDSLAYEFTSGKGFILYFYNNNEAGSSTLPVVIDITSGSEPSGDLSVDLHADNDGWNLLGNPFSTAFDVTSITATGGSLANTVGQIWSDEDESYILTSANDNKVAAGQGFFIQNDTSGAGTPATSVTLPVSGKTTGTRFYKSSQKQSAFVQLALKARDLEQRREQKDISSVLYFTDEADAGWDKWDAEKLYPLKSSYSLLNIVSLDNEKARTQDSRPFENEGEEVFFFEIESMNVNKTQVLEWNKSSNIPDSWTFTFTDNKTGTELLMDEDFSYEFIQDEVGAAQQSNQAKLKEVLTVTKSSTEPRFKITVNKGNAVTNEPSSKPTDFTLNQNYPNPFNPTTTIYYSIPEAGEVNLTIYNVMGQRVHTLVDERKSAGEYRATWNATNMASGIYYYRFNFAGQVITRQMTLIK